MTVRYCDGTGAGNNAYDGLAAVWDGTHGPKASLNGAEDSPVAAGDLVHVRSGTYREKLTVDVSGTAGNAIEYRGDYQGLIWPGGGVVRITGSDDDLVATRANGIVGSAKSYRTFRGLFFDTCTGYSVSPTNATSYWVINQCMSTHSAGLWLCNHSGDNHITIGDCVVYAHQGYFGLASQQLADNGSSIIENCLIVGGQNGIYWRQGGTTIRNCTVLFANVRGMYIATNGTGAGQTVTVNNCVIANAPTGLVAGSLGMMIEDYNNVYGCSTARSNVAVGANSLAYPPLFDARWFFELVAGGKLLSPFDLASYSKLVNVAGTSPTTTDMRGTAVIGAERELGALEYDPTLSIEAGSGGAVSISPMRGGLIG